VVAIAEQTANGTQQVAGTAKQLSGSMQELTTSSQQLNEIAEDLQVAISAFKLINSSYIPNNRAIRRLGFPTNNREAVVTSPRIQEYNRITDLRNAAIMATPDNRNAIRGSAGTNRPATDQQPPAAPAPAEDPKKTSAKKPSPKSK
jgi:hypothetical protein